MASAPGGTVQSGLFPKRVSTRYPGKPNGQDVAFMCEVAEGGTYYCKDDTRGKPVRLTEWVSTRLASHLGIATAECAVIEDEHGNSYFGSRNHQSTVAEFSAGDFLGRPRKNELGQISEWPGRYLSGVLIIDLLLNNPDRDFTNFVLHREASGYRVCAIDFGSADLNDLSGMRFPVATSRTIIVGKLLTKLHGFFADSALEMVDRVAAVPRDVIVGFLNEIPADWANATQKEGVCDAWLGPDFDKRLAGMRSGLLDGSFV